jgi:hypothetical protein
MLTLSGSSGSRLQYWRAKRLRLILFSLGQVGQLGTAPMLLGFNLFQPPKSVLGRVRTNHELGLDVRVVRWRGERTRTHQGFFFARVSNLSKLSDPRHRCEAKSMGGFLENWAKIPPAWRCPAIVPAESNRIFQDHDIIWEHGPSRRQTKSRVSGRRADLHARFSQTRGPCLRNGTTISVLILGDTRW